MSSCRRCRRCSCARRIPTHVHADPENHPSPPFPTHELSLRSAGSQLGSRASGLAKRRLLIGRYRNRCHRQPREIVYANVLIKGLTAVAMERRRRRLEASVRSREPIISRVLCCSGCVADCTTRSPIGRAVPSFFRKTPSLFSQSVDTFVPFFLSFSNGFPTPPPPQPPFIYMLGHHSCGARKHVVSFPRNFSSHLLW